MLTLPNVKLPIIAGVAHDQFKALGREGMRVLDDLKYVLPRDAADLRL